MKRLIAALIASAILIAALVAPASASQKRSLDGKPAAPAYGWGYCTNPVETNIHTGSAYNPSAGTHGTKASIATTLHLCERLPYDLNENGPSAWVSLEPGVSGSYDPGSAIFQVGTAMCDSLIDHGDACYDHPGEYIYFWAYGGCNGYEPYMQFLGHADQLFHTFSVKHLSSGFVAVSPASTVTLQDTHPAVSCWANLKHESNWFSERWDYGDGFYNQMASMGYIYGTKTTWSTTNWSPTHCFENSDDYCFREGSVQTMYTID